MHRNPSAVLLTLFAAMSATRIAQATDVVVVRVGDGGAALAATAAPVFLERYASDGTPTASPIALPTAASGPNAIFTLTGTATSEGALTVSSDGNYLTLGGYAAATGSAIAGTSRVVALIDALGTVDTTTTLSNAFTTNIRGAVTVDGSSFWISGSGSSNGGVWYELYGLNGGTQLLTTPSSTRWVNIFSGQLYGDSGSGSFTNVFTVGSGLPTSINLTATSLPGLPTSSASPYGFVFFDRSSVAGLDTLYVADDRAVASGGGIQKWTFNGSTWALQKTLASGLATGVRGLAAEVIGAHVVLYATTTEAAQNHLVRVVDDGSASPAVSTIVTAATNTVYRGAAMAWAPPMVDIIFFDGFE